MAREYTLKLLTVQPFTRINDGWKINDPGLKNLLQNFDVTRAYSNFEDSYSVQLADPLLHQRPFLHVVTETIFDYPHNANGEKTMKPIMNFRPFVLLCVPGALQELKDLGFKTFSDWWNEDYDQIVDPTQRLYAILDIVKWVCNQELDDLKQLMEQMRPTLEHNYQHYYNSLLSDQIKKFDQACCDNLKPR
jgi:hypothetical protein